MRKTGASAPVLVHAPEERGKSLNQEEHEGRAFLIHLFFVPFMVES
jgi:hypothetical protein